MSGIFFFFFIQEFLRQMIVLVRHLILIPLSYRFHRAHTKWYCDILHSNAIITVTEMWFSNTLKKITRSWKTFKIAK